MRTIALYTTETMADWEYAYLTTQIAGAEQLKPRRFRLLLVGDGLEPVRTLGNLPLAPEADLNALDALAEEGSLAALVIPGGDHYAAGHDRLIEAVGSLLEKEIPVAAICGATLLLARGGFLDDRGHTSNASVFLQTSGYRGGNHYVETPVVTDRGVTTASGGSVHRGGHADHRARARCDGPRLGAGLPERPGGRLHGAHGGDLRLAEQLRGHGSALASTEQRVTTTHPLASVASCGRSTKRPLPEGTTEPTQGRFLAHLIRTSYYTFYVVG